MSMMMSFWNETLKNISQDQRNDKFVFIVNNERFVVSLSYALGISQYILEEYLKDPTFREFVIQEEEKIEEEFSKFINGKEIKKDVFFKIGKLLKNHDMIDIWKKSNSSTKETAIEYLKCTDIINYNHDQSLKDGGEIIDVDDIKEGIKYIAEHLEEMKEEVKQVTEEGLIYLLRNENLSIKSEDTIWEITKERIKGIKKEIYDGQYNKAKIEKKRKMRRILLENIEIKCLNKENFQEYLQEIESEDIISSNNDLNNKEKGCIWNQIQEFILNNLSNMKCSNSNNKKNNEMLREHIEGHDFDGIIKFLEDKYGKDLNKLGVVSINVSRTGNCVTSPSKVIKYDWKSSWSSQPFPGQWWEINFKKLKVSINGYSIKSSDDKINSHHLKNWAIEGRNEGEEWEEIDRQDTFVLNGPSYQHYFPLDKKAKPFQYIRIKSLGRDHYGYIHNENYYYISLTNFEIFGEIIKE